MQICVTASDNPAEGKWPPGSNRTLVDVMRLLYTLSAGPFDDLTQQQFAHEVLVWQLLSRPLCHAVLGIQLLCPCYGLRAPRVPPLISLPQAAEDGACNDCILPSSAFQAAL